MPFADPEARRAYDRQRYAVEHGLVFNPGKGSDLESLPEFVPRQEKVAEFQPKGHRRNLATAENWLRAHSPTITVVIIPLAVGVGVGFGVSLFSCKYLVELGPRAKSFLSAYLQTSNNQPGPVKNSMEALLDFAEGVMNRSSTTY